MTAVYGEGCGLVPLISMSLALAWGQISREHSICREFEAEHGRSGRRSPDLDWDVTTMACDYSHCKQLLDWQEWMDEYPNTGTPFEKKDFVDEKSSTPVRIGGLFHFAGEFIRMN